MSFQELWSALLLGIVEGLTEFLPISSTGHMILVGELIGFEGPPGKTFEIAIQLGAIMAVVVVFLGKLLGIAGRMFTHSAERRYVINILLAFLPALVLGATLYGPITTYLYAPLVVALALIVGGVVIIAVEKLRREPDVLSVEALGPGRALAIGFGQVLAMIPGTSRSGATIIMALMLGMERKAAAEFSFILAIPTMIGAAAFTIYKNWAVLDAAALNQVAVGFVAAFLVALVVVKAVMAVIGRIGFTPFGWYRIGLGAIILVWLAAR